MVVEKFENECVTDVLGADVGKAEGQALEESREQQWRLDRLEFRTCEVLALVNAYPNGAEKVVSLALGKFVQPLQVRGT